MKSLISVIVFLILAYFFLTNINQIYVTNILLLFNAFLLLDLFKVIGRK
jgi:hypothetical protein